MIRFIHTADIHFSKENRDKAMRSLDKLISVGREKETDLFAFAGDLFDRAVQNTDISGLPDLQKIIQKMLDIAPIAAISGTPTHDLAGCYEIFTRIKAKHNFVLIQPGKAYFLVRDKSGKKRITESEDEQGSERLALVLGCPEPGKEWFIANSKGIGIEASNRLITDGMRELLLGLSALRKSHSSVPCIFLYHGNITGSTFQNGRQMQEGCGISMGRDDLALLDADYYGLGHIHLSQQIGNLPAWYAGSIYPVNWGETDQKTFNYVELEYKITQADTPSNNGTQFPAGSKCYTKVEKIPYPHPPRKKIRTDFADLNQVIESEDYKGHQVWVEVKIEKDKFFLFKPDNICELLMEKGAKEGSRVTACIIPEETVRAAHIQELTGLREKVDVYAECSGKKLDTGILEKADHLEAEAKKDGLKTEGLHIRINKLILRGAIGILKGQEKEEIEIDLDKYDTGLVALVGKNGAGKTTLIENMHPYPCLLTRAKKLQDHFNLRDSFRDLYFTDEKTGIRYRSLIRIDGGTQAGKIECHLFKKNGDQYEPIVNGRKEDYQKRIEELFGSLSLYLRTAFVCQKATKNNPEITDAIQSQRKALLRELAGLDYLQTYCEMTRSKTKELESETTHINGKIEGLRNLVKELPSHTEQLEIAEAEYEKTKKELEKLEKLGQELKTETETLRKQAETVRQAKIRVQDLVGRISELEKEKESLITSVSSLRESLKTKDSTEKDIARYNSLKKEEELLINEMNGIHKKREKLRDEYLKEKHRVDTEIKRVEAEVRNFEKRRDDYLSKKQLYEQKLNYLEERLQEKTECPSCGHVFCSCKDKAKIEYDIGIIKEEIKKSVTVIRTSEKELANLSAKIKEIGVPEEPDYPRFDDARLEEIENALLFFDIELLRKKQMAASVADTKIRESETRITEIGNKIIPLKAEIDIVTGRIDEQIELQYQNKEKKLTGLREEYTDCRDRVQRLDTEIKHFKKYIRELNNHQNELDQLTETVKVKRNEISQWRYLEEACGIDGIQALELDVLSPNITTIANRLLEAAYGTRFQIEFRTTRLGGNGSHVKQIEDFLIIIHDSEKGTEQEMSTLSGGEAVWIKKAIYDAFDIIRARNTGTKFLTVFQDEADGALDPESKIAYFRMLEAAHYESNRHHTIVITHSPEAREMIRQKINMEELKEPSTKKIKEEAVA